MTVTSDSRIISIEFDEPEFLREAYLNGLQDDQTGSVDEEGYHHYRVGRYVVETNTLGFHVTAEFDTSQDADDFMEGQK